MLAVKSSLANGGDIRDKVSISGSGRSPGGGHGNPLQCSCLENPMDRGAWWATVHRVPNSWTWPKWLGMHTCKLLLLELRSSSCLADSSSGQKVALESRWSVSASTFCYSTSGHAPDPEDSLLIRTAAWSTCGLGFLQASVALYVSDTIGRKSTGQGGEDRAGLTWPEGDIWESGLLGPQKCIHSTFLDSAWDLTGQLWQIHGMFCSTWLSSACWHNSQRAGD